MPQCSTLGNGKLYNRTFDSTTGSKLKLASLTIWKPLAAENFEVKILLLPVVPVKLLVMGNENLNVLEQTSFASLVISSIHHQHQQPKQKQQRIDTVVCNARGPEANLRLIIQYVLHTRRQEEEQKVEEADEEEKVLYLDLMLYSKKEI
uniref:Uncharacterized protein n=1 Tax=Glossina pallidipes TaxID=7398 RepID=A0A1A9ZW38_GLOPL